MLKALKRRVAPYYTNLSGWRTNRKIVVIESDDWGSIRMPSKEVYHECLRNGYRVDKIAYEKFDSLASEEDLEMLFDLLMSFKDINGRYPVITANVLAANPDFKKIRDSGYERYYYEKITDTFSRYPRHGRCFNLWKEGKGEGVFFPQSHGREHLNVSMFMKALSEGDRDVQFGFRMEMPGCIPNGGNLKTGNRYVETLAYMGESDKSEKLDILIEGLNLFEELFEYRSKSFIPPNYLWHPEYDSSLAAAGVKFYQGHRKTKEPFSKGSIKIHTRRLGEQNKNGQKYLVRNAIFEPSLFKMKIKDPVGNCLNQISTAFRMNKPAIICSHRINYVGYIDKKNRDRNLKLLTKLLNKIMVKWPDVEFMTSVQLGEMMDSDI